MKHLATIICLFFSIVFLPQEKVNQQKIDSLLQCIQVNHDNIDKVNQYQKIIEEYEEKDISKINYYNLKIKQLAQAARYARGEGFYYINKSTIKEYEGKDFTNEAKKASLLMLHAKDTKNYLKAQYMLGTAHLKKERFNAASACVKKAIILAYRQKDSLYIGRLYRLLGFIAFSETNYDISLKYCRTAFDYFNKIPNTDAEISRTYIVLSNAYFMLFRENESNYYLQLARQKSNRYHIDIQLQAANILMAQGKLDRTIQELLRLKKRKKSKRLEIVNDMTLAGAYLYQEKPKLAIPILSKMLSDTLVPQTKKFVNLNTISICYLKIKKYNLATHYINKALQIEKTIKNDYYRRNIFYTKFSIEKEKKNNKLALQYLEKFTSLLEKSFDDLSTGKLLKLQNDLVLQEKNNQINRLNYKKKQNEMELKNYQFKMLLFIVIVLFITVFSIYIMWINKKIKTKNKIIKLKNNLLDQNVQQKITLLKEIHHRVKNNMQLVISLLKIQSRTNQRMSIDDFIAISENRIRSMALIHEFLYESDELSYINFDNYLNGLIHSIKNSFVSEKNIIIQKEIANLKFPIEISIALGLIINELIMNAFKHAFKDKEDGEITIRLQKKDNNCQLIISDNGIGIHHQNITNTTSVGLKIIKLLVTQIEGKLEIKNNNGSIFTITFYYPGM